MVTFTLENVEDGTEEFPHPDTIPERAERANIVPGQLVKLSFRIVKGKEVTVERMWVLANKSVAGQFVGILQNNPRSSSSALRAGETLAFGPQHVLAIDRGGGGAAATTLPEAEYKKRSDRAVDAALKSALFSLVAILIALVVRNVGGFGLPLLYLLSRVGLLFALLNVLLTLAGLVMLIIAIRRSFEYRRRSPLKFYAAIVASGSAILGMGHIVLESLGFLMLLAAIR